jgi:hypothetical protein
MLSSYHEELGDSRIYTKTGLEEIEEHKDWGKRALIAYQKQQMPNDTFKPIQIESEFQVKLGTICWSCGEPYKAEWEGDLCPHCESTIYQWMGRADLIVSRKGGLWIVDHKCVKNVTQETVGAWRASFQQLGYVYGVEQSTGMKVKGYMINFIKKLKTIGTEKQKGVPFVRTPWFDVDTPRVNSFIHNRLQTIMEIEAEDKKDLADAWRMADTGCRQYASCPYIDICWNPEHDREWHKPNELILANDYDSRELDYVDLKRGDLT